jgi:hypothetical protein
MLKQSGGSIMKEAAAQSEIHFLLSCILVLSVMIPSYVGTAHPGFCLVSYKRKLQG